MLLLKKIATLMTMPLTVLALVMETGTLLQWLRRRQRVATVMLPLDATALNALSLGEVSDGIIHEAETMASMALMLRVCPDDNVREPTSRVTEEQERCGPLRSSGLRPAPW